MTVQEHILLVGATGMLSGLARRLHEQGHRLSLVSRSTEGFEKLAQGRSGFHHLQVSYTDANALERGMQHAMEERGPFSRAICWIHSTAPAALEQIATLLLQASPSKQVELVHVVGSAWADPTRLPHPQAERLRKMPGLLYKQAILGFQVEAGHSRWLSHEEISEGVWDVLNGQEERGIVGVVEPWSMRP